MKKKKIIAITAAVALIGAVGIGSTLAYFTDNATTENVVTMGHVDIDLYETDLENSTAEEVAITHDGLTFKNVTPGQELAKDPTIEIQSGSSDAYVRATVNVVVDEKTDAYTNLDEDQKTALTADMAQLQDELTTAMAANGWIKSGDYYYSSTIFSTSGATGTISVDSLFTTVTIPTSWGNETADQTFYIQIGAEAIQADNFTPEYTGTAITGWGGVTAETYK